MNTSIKISIVLLLLGLGMLAYSFTLAPYKDENLFTERYLALTDGQSAEYWKLRDEMLTSKFSFQDYGATLIVGAIVIFFIVKKGWRNLISPKSRARLTWFSFGISFLTVTAYVFDLLLAYERGEFPHWADSMGIPLMGTPFLLLIMCLWSTAHLSLLPAPYRPAHLSLGISRQTHWWLLLITVTTALFVVLCFASGQYWYVVPGMGWLYFYLSIAASRQLSRDAKYSAVS